MINITPKEGYRIAKVYCTLDPDPVTGAKCKKALAAYITVGEGNPQLRDPWSGWALPGPGPHQEGPQGLQICVFPCPVKDITFPDCAGIFGGGLPFGVGSLVEDLKNQVEDALSFGMVRVVVMGQTTPNGTSHDSIRNLLEEILDKLGCNFEELFPLNDFGVRPLIDGLMNFIHGMLFVINGFPPHISEDPGYGTVPHPFSPGLGFVPVPGSLQPSPLPSAQVAPAPIGANWFPVGSTFLGDLMQAYLNPGTGVDSPGAGRSTGSNCQKIERGLVAGSPGTFGEFTVSGPCLPDNQNPAYPQGQPGGGLASPHPYDECECLCTVTWKYKKQPTGRECIQLRAVPHPSPPGNHPVAKECDIEIVGTRGAPIAIGADHDMIAKPPMIDLWKYPGCK
jgi:hypothetical protein